MGVYIVKPALRADLTLDRLLATCQQEFGDGERAEDSVTAHYGAIDGLTARIGKGELQIDLRMNPKVAPEVAAETIRRYNRFLETLTGYTAKERAKKAQKAAKAPSAG